MNIETSEKLFDHKCQIKDMRLSGFNPETLTYYCNECGGKLVVRRTKKSDAYIEKFASLRLTKRLIELTGYEPTS